MRHRTVLSLASTLVVAAGCSLIGDFSTERCQVDSDCAGRGPAGLVCIANNCEPRGSLADSGADATDGAASECTTNAECTARANEVSTACVVGRCVPVEIPGVCVLFGKDRFREPGTIMLGAFVETNPASAIGSYNVDLAALEINIAGGIPTAAGQRYVSVVACNKSTPALVKQGAAHLIDKLKVPAIYGQVETEELKAILPDAIKNDTLVVSTLANDASLRSVTNDGLLWYAVDDISRTTPAFAAVLAYAEAKVRARNGDTDVRVALLETTQSFETSALASALAPPSGATSPLRFNGKTPEANGALFFRHIKNIPSKYRNPAATYASVVTEILQFQPDIILSANGDELVANLIPGVETGWVLGDATRPIWIASPLARFSVEMYNHVRTYNQLGQRFVGVDFSGDPTVTSEYDQRLADRLSATPDLAREGHNLLYDTTYLLAHAARAALKQGPIGGRAMATGLARLVEGDPGYVGTQPVPGRDTFTEIVQGLGADRSFRLVGTSGPFAIPKDTRDRRMGQSIYCVEQKPTQVPRFRYYSIRYDEGSKTLVPVGTSPCMP